MNKIIKNKNRLYQLLHFTFQITLFLILITILNVKANEFNLPKSNSLVAQSTKKKFDTGQNPKEEITRAETLLFLDNHLAKIKSSKQFDYNIKSVGKLSKDTNDVIKVFLEFKKRVISANAELGSGKNATYLNTIKYPQNNPIILYFLERDILEMQRLTKGQPNYFRKRIRAALAEGPRIKKTNRIFDGKNISTLTFSIKPYATDPLRNSPERAKYKRYSKKTYTFVLSDKVPGHVLEIVTNIPSRSKKKILLREVLSFSKSKNM
jgi:hypothetical protein